MHVQPVARQIQPCVQHDTGGGITLAVLSAHANFAFIPYPFWVLLVIALGILVIWALAAHGRVVATDRY